MWGHGTRRLCRDPGNFRHRLPSRSSHLKPRTFQQKPIQWDRIEKKWSDNLNRFCRLPPSIVLVHQSSCIDRSLFYRSYRYCVQRLTTLRTSFDQARLALSNIFSEKVNHDREDSFLKCLLKQKIASLCDSASDRFQLWIVFFCIFLLPQFMKNLAENILGGVFKLHLIKNFGVSPFNTFRKVEFKSILQLEKAELQNPLNQDKMGPVVSAGAICFKAYCLCGYLQTCLSLGQVILQHKGETSLVFYPGPYTQASVITAQAEPEPTQ